MSAIPVREAVKKATESILELYPDRELLDLALEEVEKTEDESNWLITLGFDVMSSATTAAKSSPLLEALQGKREKHVRQYKVFRVVNSGTLSSWLSSWVF